MGADDGDAELKPAVRLYTLERTVSDLRVIAERLEGAIRFNAETTTRAEAAVATVSGALAAHEDRDDERQLQTMARFAEQDKKLDTVLEAQGRKDKKLDEVLTMVVELRDRNTLKDTKELADAKAHAELKLIEAQAEAARLLIDAQTTGKIREAEAERPVELAKIASDVTKEKQANIKAAIGVVGSLIGVLSLIVSGYVNLASSQSAATTAAGQVRVEATVEDIGATVEEAVEAIVPEVPADTDVDTDRGPASPVPVP